MAVANNQLQHLAHEEAERLARGGPNASKLLDPYALERPLERTVRMSRSQERLSVFDVKGNSIPVAAIGQVDVTDPWGNPLFGLDSPYDASIPYASNPTKLASRQSFYFGTGGLGPTASPALSGISTLSASTSGTPMVWSEVSSSSSGMSHQWHETHQKRRSISFHGDSINLSGGRRSPGASSMYERPRSEFAGAGGRRPSLPNRSSGNLPSLLGNGRRPTFDGESRKSFSAQELPPIPVDPKIAAKQARRQSKGGALLSTSTNKHADKSDAMSIRSGMSADGAGSRTSRRKSWFSRSASADANLSSLASPSLVSSPVRPPPVPTIPAQHSNGSNGSAGRSMPGTPLTSPRPQASPAASFYGAPMAATHSPVSLSPALASPLNASPLASPPAAPTRPGPAMQPSRAKMNLPSPVAEHPPLPTMLSPGAVSTRSSSLTPPPTAASLPPTPTTSSMLAPAAPIITTSPSSPPSLGLAQMAAVPPPDRSLPSTPDPSPPADQTTFNDGGDSLAPQPKGINKSLSSFHVAPPPSPSILAKSRELPAEIQQHLQLAPLPKHPSVQSLTPDQIPLPDTPQYANSPMSSSYNTPMASPPIRGSSSNAESGPVVTAGALAASNELMAATGNVQKASSGLQVPHSNGAGPASANAVRQPLRPRASSPNMRNQTPTSAAPCPAKDKENLPLPSKAPATMLKKSSKSPFSSIFKRSRSKTLGNDSDRPSSASGTATPPVPTPQLSFSSSTTSTMTSEPSDQFYADFTPNARPTYGGNSATVGKKAGGFSMFGKRSKGPSASAK